MYMQEPEWELEATKYEAEHPIKLIGLHERIRQHETAYKHAREYITIMEAALTSKDNEIDELRGTLKAKMKWIEGFFKQLNTTLNREWTEVIAEREQLDKEREQFEEKQHKIEQKPIRELMEQIVDLRCAYEEKISRLQVEVNHLEVCRPAYAVPVVFDIIVTYHRPVAWFYEPCCQCSGLTLEYTYMHACCHLQYVYSSCSTELAKCMATKISEQLD